MININNFNICYSAVCSAFVPMSSVTMHLPADIGEATFINLLRICRKPTQIIDYLINVDKMLIN